MRRVLNQPISLGHGIVVSQQREIARNVFDSRVQGEVFSDPGLVYMDNWQLRLEKTE